VQSFAGRICSETGDESSVGTSAAKRHCLIESLTSGMFGVTGSENGLARRGESLD